MVRWGKAVSMLSIEVLLQALYITLGAAIVWGRFWHIFLEIPNTD
jgi:hypothetical protein